ncbi:DUF6929 family protein [Pyxidicoccus sp. 3LFB2]
MIRTTLRRTLTLESPEAPGRPAHVSAASGLVRVGPWLYIVADDALHLAVFPAQGDAPGAQRAACFRASFRTRPRRARRPSRTWRCCACWGR